EPAVPDADPARRLRRPPQAPYFQQHLSAPGARSDQHALSDHRAARGYSVDLALLPAHAHLLPADGGHFHARPAAGRGGMRVPWQREIRTCRKLGLLPPPSWRRDGEGGRSNERASAAITPTPNPSPAGCGLARFHQNLKCLNPGKPGFGRGGERTELAARSCVEHEGIYL